MFYVIIKYVVCLLPFSLWYEILNEHFFALDSLFVTTDFSENCRFGPFEEYCEKSHVSTRFSSVKIPHYKSRTNNTNVFSGTHFIDKYGYCLLTHC